MVVEIISIVIVVIIAFYFLLKENRKHKKYMGKSVPFTSKEKKILERYRKEYEPLPSDDRLATLEKDGWELEDIAKSATEMIYDGPIPSVNERKSLQSGQLVKVKVVTIAEGQTEVERVWVSVTGNEGGLYSGTIDNDTYMEEAVYGQNIWFHPNHVFQLEKDK